MYTNNFASGGNLFSIFVCFALFFFFLFSFDSLL